MFEMTQSDLEILLQHYGWWGVSDAAEADEDEWSEDDHDISDKKWNIGYDAYITADNGHHSRFD